MYTGTYDWLFSQIRMSLVMSEERVRQAAACTTATSKRDVETHMGMMSILDIGH